MSAKKLVSVIFPTYNHGEYISEAIESVLNQTYQNFEILIWDDGSTDGTPEIVARYLKDSRLKYIRHEHRGSDPRLLSDIWDELVKTSTGEYICFFASTSIFLPQKLELQIREFEKASSLDIVHTNGFHIDEKGNILPTDFSIPPYTQDTLIRLFFAWNIVATPTVMMKRNTYLKVGGFNRNITFTADYDLWFRTAVAGGRFKYLKEKLIKYRIHKTSQSQKSYVKKTLEIVVPYIVKEMRERLSIQDIYPQLKEKDPSQFPQEFASAHNDLGTTFLNRKWPPNGEIIYNNLAIQEFKKSLEYVSDQPSVLANIGVAYMGLGWIERALSYTEKALSLEPNSEAIKQNLQTILRARQEIRKEPEILRKRTERQKDYQYLAQVLQGSYKMAEENLDRALNNIKQGKTLLDSHPVTLDYSEGFRGCKVNPPCVKCYASPGPKIEFPDLEHLYQGIEDFLKTALYIVDCPNGEPLYNPYYELLVHATSQDAPRLFHPTNGILLEKKVELIVGRVKGISLSLDATDPLTYAKLQGTSLQFENVINGLKRLIEEKEVKGTPYPSIYINHVLCKENIHKFKEFYDFITKFKIDGIHLLRLADTELLKKVERSRGDFLFQYAQQIPLEDEVVALAKKSKSPEYATPVYETMDVITTLTIGKEKELLTIDGPVCCVPWLYCVVTPSGYSSYCCYTSGQVSLGDWRIKKIKDLWNSDKIVVIRDQILKYGIPHQCLMVDSCPITRRLKYFAKKIGREEIIQKVRSDWSQAYLLRPYIQEAIKNTTRQNSWWLIHGEKVKVKDTKLDMIKRRSIHSISFTKGIEPKEKPLVSVIIPTYHRPHMLAEAIKSVLNQTYPNYEIIVINDAGENVEHVVEALNNNGRITYVRHARNKERSAARNTGLKLAQGKYIAYLDDDDIFYPEHLETLENFLESTNYKVAYTDAYRTIQVRDGDGYKTLKKDLPYSVDFNRDLLLVENISPVLCFMHEKSCLNEVGFFDEILTTHEDWDFWIRMSRKFDFAHIRKVTCEFSWREDGSTTASSKRMDFIRTKEIIHERYKEYAKHDPQIFQWQKINLGTLKKQLGIKDGNEKQRKSSDSSTIRCSIIIPLYNKGGYTKQCLKALATNTKYSNYEVILVDNASTDGTKDFLKSLGGDVKIITNETNLGFAKACNQGAKTTSGDYLIFLNNDTIPQEGWLEEMVKIAEEKQDVAVVGSKLLYPDGKVQHAGVVFGNFNGKKTGYHLYQGMDKDHPAVNYVREFNAVTAACMLVKKEIFFNLGMFDEAYINGFEDVDFCLKVREKGYKIIYNPESVLYHYEETTEGRRAHNEHNVQIFVDRWNSKIEPDDHIKAMEDGMMINYLPNCIVQVSSIETFDKIRRWIKQAHHLKEQANYYQLIKTCENILKLDSLNKDALKLMGETNQTLGNLEDAEKFFGTLISIEASSENLLSLALVQKGLKKFEEAIQNLEKAKSIVTDSQGLEVYVNLADCYTNLGRYNQGVEHYNLALKHNGKDERLHVGLGVIELQRGAMDKASEWFQKALEINAKSHKAICGLGMIEWSRGDKEKGFDRFKEVLDINGEELTALYLLIQASYQLGRLPGTETYLKGYLDIHPGDIDIMFSLAGVLYSLGKLEEARETLERILILNPRYEGAGKLLEKIGKY